MSEIIEITQPTYNVTNPVDIATLIIEGVGIQGPAGVGVPAGGSTNQVLGKASGADFDTLWVNQTGGGGGVSIGDAIGGASVSGGLLTTDSSGDLSEDSNLRWDGTELIVSGGGNGFYTEGHMTAVGDITSIGGVFTGVGSGLSGVPLSVGVNVDGADNDGVLYAGGSGNLITDPGFTFTSGVLTVPSIVGDGSGLINLPNPFVVGATVSGAVPNAVLFVDGSQSLQADSTQLSWNGTDFLVTGNVEATSLSGDGASVTNVAALTAEELVNGGGNIAWDGGTNWIFQGGLLDNGSTWSIDAFGIITASNVKTNFVQDSSGLDSIQVLDRQLLRTDTTTSIDWGGDKLFYSDGSTVALDWSTTGVVTINPTLNTAISIDDNGSQINFNATNGYNFGGGPITADGTNITNVPLVIGAAISGWTAFANLISDGSGFLTSSFKSYYISGNVAMDLSSVTANQLVIGDPAFALTGANIHVDNDTNSIYFTAEQHGFFGAAAVGQPTGGAATAGASYTSAEQAMIQTLWDNARVLGLMT